MTPEATIATIGAASAIGGALVSQIVTIWASRVEHRRSKQLRMLDKLESLARVQTDFADWQAQITTCNTLHSLTKLLALVPASKMHSICMVHFPRLSDPVIDYVNAYNSYYISLVDSIDEKSSKTAGAQAISTPAYIRAINEVAEAKHQLEQAIRKEAKRWH